MSSYNHFKSDKKPNQYLRVVLYCDTCKTPIFVNRSKDAPRFCPVCHTAASWKSINQDYKKNILPQITGITEITGGLNEY